MCIKLFYDIINLMENGRRRKGEILMKKKLISTLISTALVCQLAAVPFVSAAEVGEDLTVGGKDTATTQKTQELIAARPDMQRPMEALDRGLIAMDMEGYVFLSWRWLGTESADTLYNLYKNGTKLNAEPLKVTNYTDINPAENASYQVAPVIDGVEGEKCAAVSMWQKNYFDVPITAPEDGKVNGESYSYTPGDASVADLDGDGQYEIVLKWDPSNAKDAASGGYTGTCILDAYKLDGTRLWRIDMGPNIRAGAHDTQFLVYDFDGDGKAEMAARTADGTVAGDGTVIGDGTKNWAAQNGGKNLAGPLYLTVFKGEDGSVIDTVDYDPQTVSKDPKWGVDSWGDSHGNRSERYLAAVGYVDGARPSMLFCRGYYTGPEGDTGGRTVIAAYDLVDGKIQKKWRFDTMDYQNKYIGQGNHSMSVADVDYDGCDEIIYGSLAVDNDGKPLYSTGLGHGDAQHVGDLIPSRPGLEVFSAHEDTNSAYGYEMRDARTGEILFGEKTGGDNGRGTAGDIDPRYEGAESWSAAGVLVAADGTVISNKYTMPANFLAWWDGDLGREVQDNIYISKWNPELNKVETIFTASGCTSINGTKANPALTADLFGDWREEVMYPTKDGKALRIYSTATPTSYRIPTLMHDIQYRMHVALQNVCYNQPTHTSYYLGYDTKTIPVPQMYTKVDGKEVRNVDLSKKSWDIGELYSGDQVTLAMDTCVALINGIPNRVDNENTEVVPYLAEGDRTLVPLRFISESFGADVDWNQDTQTATVTSGETTIKMKIGETKYTVNGSSKTMEAAAVITQDRTFVPLRAVVESLGKKVYWNDGLIVISDTDVTMTDEAAKTMKQNIKNAPVPAEKEYVPVTTGEKFYKNQADVYGVEATDNDGNVEMGAVDLDMNTRWSALHANQLTIDLGSEIDVEGVAIAMWKGAERIYPFSIEYSTDGETWETALPKTQNTGESEGFEKYMFPQNVKARYIRYSGDGATDPEKNYCHISEIAVLMAQ